MALKPAVQPCIAACCAVEPAPLRLPLSAAALLLPLALDDDDSFDAPHAASASEPASAMATGMARDVVLSFNSGASRRGPAHLSDGPESDTREVREPRWTSPVPSVNSR